MTKAADDEREAFARGMERGRDPAREGQGAVVTTLRSPWLGKPCARCAFTFRRGDRVIGGASHAEKDCPDEQTSAGPSLADPERLAFYAGLAEAYPPPPELRLVRLSPGHPLLARQAPFARPACVVCGHSLRPYDQVVVCPCQSEAPLCGAAVHRDPVRALFCWDEWSKSKLSQYCPVTSRKLT